MAFPKVTPMSNDRYDIPNRCKPHKTRSSKAFRDFYRNFFVEETALIRGEVDLSFIRRMRPAEAALARELIRLNIGRGYTHIIEGAAALNCTALTTRLKVMYTLTHDMSRRLTIAGTLWKLSADSRFPKALRKMVRSAHTSLKEAHHDQILWLDNEEAILLLIELLADQGSFVRYLALSSLCVIHAGRALRFNGRLPHNADYFVSQKSDPAFLESMKQNLRKLNAERVK